MFLTESDFYNVGAFSLSGFVQSENPWTEKQVSPKTELEKAVLVESVLKQINNCKQGFVAKFTQLVSAFKTIGNTPLSS